jgi:hypothetical protein
MIAKVDFLHFQVRTNNVAGRAGWRHELTRLNRACGGCGGAGMIVLTIQNSVARLISPDGKGKVQPAPYGGVKR